jgi:hypothetical protein
MAALEIATLPLTLALSLEVKRAVHTGSMGLLSAPHAMKRAVPARTRYAEG